MNVKSAFSFFLFYLDNVFAPHYDFEGEKSTGGSLVGLAGLGRISVRCRWKDCSWVLLHTAFPDLTLLVCALANGECHRSGIQCALAELSDGDFRPRSAVLWESWCWKTQRLVEFHHLESREIHFKGNLIWIIPYFSPPGPCCISKGFLGDVLHLFIWY